MRSARRLRIGSEDLFLRGTADPFQGLIAALMEEEVLSCLIPPFEVPTKGDVAGEFTIGVTEANAVAGINRDEPHILVVGRTRSGKTNFLLFFIEGLIR